MNDLITTQNEKNSAPHCTNAFTTVLGGKYNIDSFSYNGHFVVRLSAKQQTVQLDFGDRIVFAKFYEEELTNTELFPYYNLLGNDLRTTTVIQVHNSPLVKKIESDTSGFYEGKWLKHYVIIAENHIMDIVSFDEVKVKTEN